MEISNRPLVLPIDLQNSDASKMTMSALLSRIASLIFYSCFLASCSKQTTVSVDTPLFIHFPKNTHVFEDISPDLYEAVHQQLLGAGFVLAHDARHAYQLIITVQSLDTVEKNVSPEIILLSYYIRLTCKIQVLNYAADEVFCNTISCEALVNKPHNPSLNDDFMHYAHKQLATRTARLIQQQLIAKLEHIFSSSP